MGPNNGIMGDVSQGIDLPTAPDTARDEALRELNKKAKYSRSAEFKELKERMEERITYYQAYLPGNMPVEGVNEEERGKYWLVADIVIKELRMVMEQYESAEQILKDIK